MRRNRIGKVGQPAGCGKVRRPGLRDSIRLQSLEQLHNLLCRVTADRTGSHRHDLDGKAVARDCGISTTAAAVE
jgi:hypothetical protein